MRLSKRITSKRDAVIAIALSLVVLIALDLTPLGGNTWLYLKWVECGRRPVQDAKFIIEGEVRYYVTPENFTVLRGVRNYFCSEADAERAGYSADARVYSFPHLSDSEAQQAIEKSRQIK